MRCSEALEKRSLRRPGAVRRVVQPGDSGHSRGPMDDCRVLLNERKGGLRITWALFRSEGPGGWY